MLTVPNQGEADTPDTELVPEAATPLSVPSAPTPEPEKTEDKIVLFHLNDRDYFVPKKVGPNVALGYMRDIRKRGQEYAIAALMERILGQGALDALADYDGLTEDDLDSVMKAVQIHVLGPMEKRQGKH